MTTARCRVVRPRTNAHPMRHRGRSTVLPARTRTAAGIVDRERHARPRAGRDRAPLRPGSRGVGAAGASRGRRSGPGVGCDGAGDRKGASGRTLGCRGCRRSRVAARQLIGRRGSRRRRVRRCHATRRRMTVDGNDLRSAPAHDRRDESAGSSRPIGSPGTICRPGVGAGRPSRRRPAGSRPGDPGPNPPGVRRARRSGDTRLLPRCL